MLYNFVYNFQRMRISNCPLWCMTAMVTVFFFLWCHSTLISLYSDVGKLLKSYGATLYFQPITFNSFPPTIKISLSSEVGWVSNDNTYWPITDSQPTFRDYFTSRMFSPLTCFIFILQAICCSFSLYVSKPSQFSFIHSTRWLTLHFSPSSHLLISLFL